MKFISIIGSTGSIGTSALKVIEANPDKYQLVALGAGENLELSSEPLQELLNLYADNVLIHNGLKVCRLL